jgi:hypothetical protein
MNQDFYNQSEVVMAHERKVMESLSRDIKNEDNQSPMGKQESVGKRPFKCGSTGAYIWLMFVPKTPAEYLDLARELLQSPWGDNHLFDGNEQQYNQLILDLKLMGNGQSPTNTTEQAQTFDSKAQASAPVTSSAVSAPVATRGEASIKPSLSRSKSMLFQAPVNSQALQSSVSKNDEVILSSVTSDLDDDGRPDGFSAVDDRDSSPGLHGFHHN